MFSLNSLPIVLNGGHWVKGKHQIIAKNLTGYTYFVRVFFRSVLILPVLLDILKVRKATKIINRYNKVLHLIVNINTY